MNVGFSVNSTWERSSSSGIGINLAEEVIQNLFVYLNLDFSRDVQHCTLFNRNLGF